MDSPSPASLFIMSDMERLKCGLFSLRMIMILVVFCILCVCLSALVVEPIPKSKKSYHGYKYISKSGKGCGTKGCKCQVLCECEYGYCVCMRKCNINAAQVATSAPVVEGFGNVTTKADKESFRAGAKFNLKQSHITRKFEMVAQNNELNAPKNLLFGEGEFIFSKDQVNVFIIASLYTIGANLYAAKDQKQVTKLHYNVYLGDANKQLKGKLGELKRSLDGRYKLELVSKSKQFIDFIAQNEYIVIRLEDDDNTLRQHVLEAFY